MRIAVFGATGRTGRPLVEQALERSHEVVAFVRDAEGITLVEGDVYSGGGGRGRDRGRRRPGRRGRQRPRSDRRRAGGPPDRGGTDLSLGMSATAARANVAEFVLDCLEDDLYVHEMPKIADQ